jgi:hypothetical protein
VRGWLVQSLDTMGSDCELPGRIGSDVDSIRGTLVSDQERFDVRMPNESRVNHRLISENV